MKTDSMPICKNKNGNVSDADNYRSVSLETIIYKLFQHCFLSCILLFVATNVCLPNVVKYTRSGSRRLWAAYKNAYCIFHHIPMYEKCWPTSSYPFRQHVLP